MTDFREKTLISIFSPGFSLHGGKIFSQGLKNSGECFYDGPRDQFLLCRFSETRLSSGRGEKEETFSLFEDLRQQGPSGFFGIRSNENAERTMPAASYIP